MKANMFRRVITLALVLVLALQFAVPAFAARVNWREGGYTWHATVTKSGYATRYDKPITSATVYHHANDITSLDGYYDLTYTTSLGIGDYVSYLTQAADEAGLRGTCTEDQQYMYNGGYEIGSWYPAGYYCIRTDVYGYKGNCEVYKEEYGVDIIMFTDTISFAPYGFYDHVTGFDAL